MEIEKYKMIYKKKFDEEQDVYFDEEFSREQLSDDIRILGPNFVKNNKNKAKLIINNKKNILKELVDIKVFPSDKIKIKLIFNKGITNISHMFENCSKLIELSIYDNKININDEEQEYHKFIEYYNDSFDYSDDNNNNTQNNFYKNLRTDNIYSNCSQISNGIDIGENNNNST